MTARRLFGGAENVLARMNRMVLSGMYQPPVWYFAVRRVPPIVQLSQAHPGALVFPEDRLYPALYRRVPSLQDEALLHTDAQAPTVGSQLARAWWKEIEKSTDKDEDTAWARVLQDPQARAWLAEHQRRVEQAAELPVTAGNVSRHLERRLHEMNVIRRLAPDASPQQRRAELQRGLDIVDAGRRQTTAASVTTEEDGAKDERRGLERSGRQWVVPDMNAAHQLRFVMAPANDALNERYGRSARRPLPLPPNRPEDDALQWAMSAAVVHDSASIRDWIAYALRLQLLVLARTELLPWKPYTDPVDATLWHQARVVLRCSRIEALEGEDVEEKRTQLGDSWPGTDGLHDERPLVYHRSQPKLSVDEQRKHALLLALIDDAVARFDFTTSRQPSPQPPPTSDRSGQTQRYGGYQGSNRKLGSHPHSDY